MEAGPLRRAVLLAVVLGALASGTAGSDTVWPLLRGTPGGRGTCRWVGEPGAPDMPEWHFTIRTRHRYRPGLAVWASPALAVVEGRPMAFIGGYDQTMHALDLAGRQQRWFKITNGEVGSAPAVGLVDGRQVVFWASADRSVYAHAARDGRRLWTRELVPATTSLGEVKMSAPLLHGGHLYVTCFAYDRAIARSAQAAWLVALDAGTGREAWRTLASNGPVSSPVGREIDGRYRVFVAAQKGSVLAFDVGGAGPVQAWRYQMAHEVLGSPVVQEDGDSPLLFLGSKFGSLVAVDARTGRERWKRMAGNWIDNTACIGEVASEPVVFTGSHDYKVYAFRARDGEQLWSRPVGGEVYSAPSFFDLGGRPAVAVAALDNHLYVLDAADGRIVTSYFTGAPIWDKVAKGSTLWGSPAVLEAGSRTVIVHGSFSNTVYSLPVLGECSLRAKARSAAGLWRSLGLALVLFLGVVLPVVLRWPGPREPETAPWR